MLRCSISPPLRAQASYGLGSCSFPKEDYPGGLEPPLGARGRPEPNMRAGGRNQMALTPFLTLPKLCMEQDGKDEAPLPHVQLSSLDRCSPNWGAQGGFGGVQSSQQTTSTTQSSKQCY